MLAWLALIQRDHARVTRKLCESSLHSDDGFRIQMVVILARTAGQRDAKLHLSPSRRCTLLSLPLISGNALIRRRVWERPRGGRDHVNL